MAATGLAPLGYGDGGLNTTVSFGDDEDKKHITSYFRHHFDVPNAEALGKLVFLSQSRISGRPAEPEHGVEARVGDQCTLTEGEGIAHSKRQRTDSTQ
jgi:hypothetical protein